MKRCPWIVCLMMVLAAVSACSKTGESPTTKTETPAVTGQTGETAREAAPEPSAGPAAQTASTDGTAGEKVFNKVCNPCHGEGIAGAPKMGDKEVWKDRISQGMDTLASHAIQGYHGSKGSMPAKGGDPSLSDDDAKAAVKYMVEHNQ